MELIIGNVCSEADIYCLNLPVPINTYTYTRTHGEFAA